MNIVIETKKVEAIALCNSIISDVTKGYECLGTVGALIVALSAIDRLRAVDECKKEESKERKVRVKVKGESLRQNQEGNRE